jgi:aspartate-semialdehyde dehydrogenase
MMADKGFSVAVVGATGLVGETMMRILEERDFPVGKVKFLASERSAGKKVLFRGKEYPVEVLSKDSFTGVRIALCSPGASVSREFLPSAVRAGCICIDNTSAYRMDPTVPLVVPEVNPYDLDRHQGIIANPNCSTIQMVVVLKPLHDAARIRRVVVSTYQSVSGAGTRALDELANQTADVLAGKDAVPKALAKRIAFNLIPQIDVFLENGYTKEEMKMTNETKKIMGDDSILVTATCVRVPVRLGHSEAVTIETERKLSPAEAREILAKAPGVTVLDDPSKGVYPMPVDAAGKNDTFVGRIREDVSHPHGLNFWVVSDNIRKGAALNAVQIAEELVRRGLVTV